MIERNIPFLSNLVVSMLMHITQNYKKDPKAAIVLLKIATALWLIIPQNQTSGLMMNLIDAIADALHHASAEQAPEETITGDDLDQHIIKQKQVLASALGDNCIDVVNFKSLLLFQPNLDDITVLVPLPMEKAALEVII